MHGVFITPNMKSLLNKMDRIEQAAAARSPGSLFPAYTQEEHTKLNRLHQEYRAEKEKEKDRA